MNALSRPGDRLPFRLYLISDRSRMGPDPLGLLAALARSGLRAAQWREKDLSAAETYEILSRAEPFPPTFHLFVNDRADLAQALALSLHLTEASLPTEAARRLLPRPALIGRSTHSLEGAGRAQREGADFVTFGPVYETPSKRPYGPPLGLDRLREVCSSVALPVFALGGITEERVEACRGAGAYGVAVIGAVWGAADPARALRDLRTAVGDEDPPEV